MFNPLKLLIFLLFLSNFHFANAQIFDDEISKSDYQKLARSNWGFSLSFFNIQHYSEHQYQGTLILNPNGTQKFFHAYEPETFTGLGIDLQLRKEFKLTNRFSFSVGAGLNYAGDSDSRDFKLEKDSDINIAETKEKLRQLGFSLNFNLYLFHFHAWYSYKIQPYLTASYSLANSELHYSYFYNNYGSTDPAPVDDLYDVTFEDKISTIKFGGGFEIISSTGAYSFFQLTSNTPSASESTRSGTYRNNSQNVVRICGGIKESASCSKNATDLGSYLSLTVGLGYRF